MKAKRLIWQASPLEGDVLGRGRPSKEKRNPVIMMCCFLLGSRWCASQSFRQGRYGSWIWVNLQDDCGSALCLVQDCGDLGGDLYRASAMGDSVTRLEANAGLTFNME